MTTYQYKSKAHGDWLDTDRPYNQSDLEYRVKPDYEEVVKYYDVSLNKISHNPNGKVCFTFNKVTGDVISAEVLP
jgi:hypothetical protein